MTKADDRLKALFAGGEPPARDPGFSAEVMEKVMRRRFFEDVALLSVVSLMGAIALWAVWPTLQAALVAISQGLAPALGAVALVLCVGVILSGRAGAAIGLES